MCQVAQPLTSLNKWRSSLWSCGWRYVNGRMGTATSITPALFRKWRISRTDFHSEHHFEGFHLQMPRPPRILTVRRGGSSAELAYRFCNRQQDWFASCGHDCPCCLICQQSRASAHLGRQNRCAYCDCQGNHCGTAHICRRCANAHI